MRSSSATRRRGAAPAPSGGSGRGRRSRRPLTGDAGSRSQRAVVDRLDQQLLDQPGLTGDGLRRAGRPASSARCSSRSVSRHDGSQPTIGTPRSASGASRAAIAAAIAARLVEQALGDARPPAAAGALQPHAPAGRLEQLDRRAADRGLGVGRERVGEEDDVAARRRRRGAPGAGPSARRSRARSAAAGARRSIPTVRSSSARAAGSRAGRLDSGASAAPARLRRRIAPNSRERSGTPWMSW